MTPVEKNYLKKKVIDGTLREYNYQVISFMSDQISDITTTEFEEQVIQSDIPVLVDYWAEWCGPCKLIGPVLEDIVDDYAGKVKIVKVNVDENQDVAQTYGIRGIPTLMLFKNGDIEATKMGAVSKSQLSAFLDQNL